MFLKRNVRSYKSSNRVISSAAEEVRQGSQSYVTLKTSTRMRTVSTPVLCSRLDRLVYADPRTPPSE